MHELLAHFNEHKMLTQHYHSTVRYIHINTLLHCESKNMPLSMSKCKAILVISTRSTLASADISCSRVSVCLFVQFFSAVFDPISIKLGHVLYVWV